MGLRSAIVREMRLRTGWPVYISDKSYREPDFAIDMSSALLPGYMGEVSYSRRFTRQQLEEKYHAYLTNPNNKVQTVMCANVYYTGTGVNILKTATDLHRSSISVWILRDGIVETVVDWVPLS